MNNENLIDILYSKLPENIVKDVKETLPTSGIIRIWENWKLGHDGIQDTYWLENETQFLGESDDLFWKTANQIPEFKNYFLQIGW